MVEYILCYGGPAEHWGPLPATRLANRKILYLLSKISKSVEGQHSGYSVTVIAAASPPPPTSLADQSLSLSFANIIKLLIVTIL